MNRAVLLMIGASVCFTVMFGFVKVARVELGAFEVMVWRGLIAVPLAWWLVRRRGGSVAVTNRRLMVVRMLFGFGAMSCFFASAAGLGLSDITFIHKLQPVILALLAPWVLGAGERASRRVWVVLAAGLVGCALLLGPRPPSDVRWGLLALLGSAFSACAHLAVRRLSRTDGPAVVVLWFQLGMTAIAFTADLVTTGAPMQLPPLTLVPVLLGCGLAAAGGQLMLTQAYALDRATKVAAASYVSPIWAVVGDLLFFAIIPTPTALLGGVVIMAAGLYLVLAPATEARAESSAEAEAEART